MYEATPLLVFWATTTNISMKANQRLIGTKNFSSYFGNLNPRYHKPLYKNTTLKVSSIRLNTSKLHKVKGVSIH